MTIDIDLHNSAIEVTNLTKTFGKGDQKVEAVKGISLVVKKGEIFGFLGPNGAGKTTSLRMMVGLLQPNAGEVKIFGVNPDDRKYKSKIKRMLGIIPQEISLYEELTVEENLWFMAHAYRLPKQEAKERIDTLISRVGLEDKRNSRVKNLSGGLRRRTNVIMGLVHNPEIILCDEPTPGLDPQSRVVVWEFINNLPNEGKTVILTTHFMEEADRLSDRVAIIDNGEILVLDTPDKLKASIGEGDLVEFTLSEKEEAKLQEIAISLKKMNDGKTTIEDAYQTGTLLMVRSLDIVSKLSRILNYIEDMGVEVENMSIRSTTLEDVFIHLTGRALRD